jgi:hypothetical protein
MTTTADRCDCCDLPAYSCGKAAEQRQRAEEQEELKHLGPGWVAALYPGVCTTCGEPFGRATSIRKVRDGWQGRCCG